MHFFMSNANKWFTGYCTQHFETTVSLNTELIEKGENEIIGGDRMDNIKKDDDD